MRIVNNYEYNSIELYFGGKPDEMTRGHLKCLNGDGILRNFGGITRMQ